MENRGKGKKENHCVAEDIILHIPDFSQRMNYLIILHKAGISYPDPEYYINRKRDWFSENGYVLEYVISGRGYIEYQGNVYSVKAGDFYLINRGIHCCYYSDEKDPFHKIWINAIGRLFNALIYAYNISEPILIEPCEGSYDCFLRIHEILKQCTAENIFRYYPELTEEFTKLFIEVDKARNLASPQFQNNVVNFQMVVQFVHDNITNRELNVDYIARSFFISRMTLYRLFQKNAGISPQEYIEDARIKFAQNALLFNRHTIAGIAQALHYKNTRCFTLAFKRRTGLSPTEWRRRNILDIENS